MKQLKISKQLTNRDTASLDKYLSEISRVELISADEEILLAQKIRKGDRAALDRLAKANLRFVVSVAKQYQNQGMQLPDLISEGNLGLIKAAKRFDEKRGLPLNKIGAINKINRAYSDLEQRLERPPSAQEIADLLECSVNDVKQSLVNNTRHISMDSPLGNDDTSKLSLYDILPNDTLPSPENQLMVESLRKDIDRSLSTLSSREMTVMRLYFGLNGVQPMSLEEIGGRFDLTRERVRQIKEKAIRNLRQASRNQVLRPYLG
jgi:RNA polymerase primary sigma factor